MKDGLGAVQSVLVLGGGSEIGLATARALVRERARTVILATRDPGRIEPEAESLRRLGADVETAAFDAKDFDSHTPFIDGLFDSHADIDAAIVAFGILGDQAAAERDPALAIDVANTNYVGAVSVLIPLARRMREQGHGHIVVLSSVAGERGRKSNFIYGSSKAGLDAFSQGMADELYGSGVRVTVVRPGFVIDRMTAGLKPIPFSTTPDEAAKAIVAAMKRDANTVWVPAPLRFVMTALRHVPRPIFRRLNI